VPPSSNLFNTGPELVSVSFNRGTFVLVNAVPPPWFTPQQGYPAPSWDPGGPSPGNIGPGPNSVSLQTSGVVLPLLTLEVPNQAPTAVQTYLIWSYDPKTSAATLGVMVLSSGRAMAWDSISGAATRSG
jgi:hypothetical protein